MFLNSNRSKNYTRFGITACYRNYFIKVMIYQQLTDKSQAASALGVPPFFVRDYQTAARYYTLPKLAAIIGYLKDADLKSKGVNNANTITDGELMKELVFKILH